MKTREDYEFEIRAYHKAISDDPFNAAEYITKRDKIIPKWMETLPVTVFVDNREQTPWDLEAVGFDACPMPVGIGLDPVSDYMYWIDTPGKNAVDCFGPLLVERKNPDDFYGTMFGSKKTGKVNPRTGKPIMKKNRDVFYEEIRRFHRDKRFNQLLVVVECDISDWRKLKPTVSKDYDETSRTRDVNIDHKDSAVASLLARGAMPVFAGSRERAPMFYRHLVRQNIIKNWERWVL